MPGMTAVGLGFGNQIRANGLEPTVVVGNDYRAYSLEVRSVVVLGLKQAGCRVLDIGIALTSMAYRPG